MKFEPPEWACQRCNRYVRASHTATDENLPMSADIRAEIVRIRALYTEGAEAVAARVQFDGGPGWEYFDSVEAAREECRMAVEEESCFLAVVDPLYAAPPRDDGGTS